MTMEYWPYGRISTYHATQQSGYKDWLSKRVSEASSSDVIVANLGIHWDYKASVADFEAAIVCFFELMGWDKNITDRCQSNNNHHHDKAVHERRNMPIVLWRETSPQHFNTSNGHYPGDSAPERFKSCAPATASRASGSALGNECIPNCLPTNWHNEAANSLAQSSCVTIIHMWKELICLHDYHKGRGDCAHMLDDEKTQALFHWKLLLTLLPLGGSSIPQKWQPPNNNRSSSSNPHEAHAQEDTDLFFTSYF
jgi:hypothetical protein